MLLMYTFARSRPRGLVPFPRCRCAPNLSRSAGVTGAPSAPFLRAGVGIRRRNP